MYINGEVDPTTVSTSGGIGTNALKVAIGAWDTGSGFNEFLEGIVDEVRISVTPLVLPMKSALPISMA